MVGIESWKKIEVTLTAEGRTRGFLSELDMPGCPGRRIRVAFPLRRIVSERTGRRIPLNDAVVLNEWTCGGLVSATVSGQTASTALRSG